jgi:hypothetical protein
MSGWDLALDAQNDLRASFRRAETQRFLQEEWIPGRSIDGDAAHARRLVVNAIGTVEDGDPIWIGEEVLDLVQVASERFSPEPVLPSDPFIPYGFVYLAKPILAPLLENGRLAIRAVSWAPGTSASDSSKKGFCFALWAQQGDEDDRQKDWIRSRGGSDLTLLHADSLSFGEQGAINEPALHALMKYLQVLWRLAKQEILTSSPERVSRAVRRRKSNWRDISTVQVLTLRRRSSRSADAKRDMDWSHRWWVNGHWRWQWYPSLQEHRQIWIAGYDKGPEDKPFLSKQRVVDFIR